MHTSPGSAYIRQDYRGKIMQARGYRAALLGLTVVLMLPLPRQEQLSSRAAVDPSATALAQELDAAWNARDAARFSALFTEDGTFAFPVEGLKLRGRDEIRQHYLKAFPALPPDMRHETKISALEDLAPGFRAADAEVDILGTDPKTGTPNTLLTHYHAFSVSVRTGSGWRIRLARAYPAAK